MIKELIQKALSESETNSRVVMPGTKNLNGKKAYLNNCKIEWPPTRESFALLCKALNLKVNQL